VCKTGSRLRPNVGLLFQTIHTGVARGKVYILGGHSIGHPKQNKKSVYVHCPIPNGFRDTVISFYGSKIVDKKEILRTVSNTSIYCSTDKVGTV
jgi:hypothetical protein